VTVPPTTADAPPGPAHPTGGPATQAPAASAPAPAAAPAPSLATRRPRWPYLGFFLIAAAFGWQLLLQDRILLPTNPATLAPWFGDMAPDSAAVPSNGLMMDTLIFTLPARVYNAEMLRAGEIPFWNPSVFAGYPHLALIQNNVLYPPSTIFDLIEPLSGMGYSILLHLALAGCFTFAFLRARGLADDAAFVGAAAFELNGMFLIRVSAPSYVFSGAWLPLMLLGALRLARGGGLRAGWPLLIAVTASVLGGHPQITSLCLTIAGVFLVVETTCATGLGERTLLTRLASGVGAFVVLALLGVGLAGYQVVPFLELMANSARGGVPLETYRNASTPVTGLLQAILPDAYGHPIEMDYWLPDTAQLVDGIAPGQRLWALNYSGQNLYTGIAPLVLATLAVARAPRRRDVLLFAGATLFALGVLLGTPLIDVAYALIPGFRHSRPDRILFVYMAGLSVLAAYGYATLRRAPEPVPESGATPGGRTRDASGLGATVLVTGVALAIVLWPIVPRLASAAGRADLGAWLAHASEQWVLRRALLVPELLATLALLAATVVLARRRVAARLSRAATLGLWLALLLVPSLLFGWRFNPMQHRPVLGTTTLEREVEAAGAARDVRLARILPGLPQALPANVVQLLGVDDVHGASAAGVGGYLELIDAAEPGSVAARKYFRAFRDPSIAGRKVLDLLNAGLVLANVELPAPYERIGGEDGLTLYRNPHALPRFRLVRDVATYATPEEGRARLLAADFDPTSTVLVARGEGAEIDGVGRAGDAPSTPDAAADVHTGFAGDEGMKDRSVSSPEGRVSLLGRSAHEVRLEVETPHPAVLVSSEVFYPGWQTRIDGVPATTLRVNTAFRGAVVPAGNHTVEMVFVPRSFHLGLALSLAALAAAAVLWWPRRRAPGAAA